MADLFQLSPVRIPGEWIIDPGNDLDFAPPIQLFFCPSPGRFIVTHICMYAYVGDYSAGAFSMGYNSPTYDDILPVTPFPNFTAQDQVFVIPVTGLQPFGATAQQPSLKNRIRMPGSAVVHFFFMGYCTGASQP